MIAHSCQGHLISQMSGHSLIYSEKTTQDSEVSLTFHAPSPSSVNPNINKMCVCSWVPRKVCPGGLLPGWGTGMVPTGTGEAVKGQERWLNEDFGHLLASKGKLCLALH